MDRMDRQSVEQHRSGENGPDVCPDCERNPCVCFGEGDYEDTDVEDGLA